MRKFIVKTFLLTMCVGGVSAGIFEAQACLSWVSKWCCSDSDDDQSVQPVGKVEAVKDASQGKPQDSSSEAGGSDQPNSDNEGSTERASDIKQIVVASAAATQEEMEQPKSESVTAPYTPADARGEAVGTFQVWLAKPNHHPGKVVLEFRKSFFSFDKAPGANMIWVVDFTEALKSKGIQVDINLFNGVKSITYLNALHL